MNGGNRFYSELEEGDEAVGMSPSVDVTCCMADANIDVSTS